MTASTETPDWTGQQIAYSYGGDLLKLSTAITAAISAAVAVETERCAKVCDQYRLGLTDDGDAWIAQHLAMTIRARAALPREEG